jgi:hypothetical protein
MHYYFSVLRPVKLYFSKFEILDNRIFREENTARNTKNTNIH